MKAPFSQKFDKMKTLRNYSKAECPKAGMIEATISKRKYDKNKSLNNKPTSSNKIKDKWSRTQKVLPLRPKTISNTNNLILSNSKRSILNSIQFCPE
jgi:hypothetical protein